MPAPTRVGQALVHLQEVMDDLGDVLARTKKSAHVLAPSA